jgi:glyoxylase-like metal-dependent hydrolase (beta-lactamase superfamily II)
MPLVSMRAACRRVRCEGLRRGPSRAIIAGHDDREEDAVLRVNVGDVELVSLLDGTEAYDAAKVYVDAGDALDARSDLLDPPGKVTLPFSSFLLRADGRTVLVDTGNGPEAEGRLLDELREAGARPADVDAVIFTHLHGDHTGWNIERETGAPTFPNARYLVPRGDWEHYRAADPVSRSFARDVAPLEGLGALELIDDGHSIAPSLTTLHTPGHTPGHMSIVVASSGSRAYVIGDAFITAVDVAEPDWATSFDWSAQHVRQTRAQLLGELDGTGVLLAASHLPAPGIGTFVTEGGRRTFRPLQG